MGTAKTNGPEKTGLSNDDLRVRLAAEVTLLAWIRTGLAMMGFGFVVARFGLFLQEIALTHQEIPTHSHGLSLWIGICLVTLGVSMMVLAAFQHWRLLQRTDRHECYCPPRCPLGVVLAVALAILGSFMVLYLLLPIGPH